MHKIILLFIIVCFRIVSFEQQSSIDSLNKVLLTVKDDTNKVKTLVNLTSLYLQGSTDYKKALLFAEQSQHLAKKLSYKKELALTCMNLGAIYGYFGLYEKAFDNNLSALKIWEALKDSEMIIQSYYNLSSGYSLQGKYKKSLQVDLMLEKLIEKKKDKQKIITALWAVGTNYSDFCKQAVSNGDSLLANYNYNEAIEYLLKILKITKDSDGVAFFNNCIGHIYDKCNLCEENKILPETNIIKVNYYKKAEESYFTSLEIYQRLNKEDGVCDCYSNLGLFYRNQGNLAFQSNKNSEANIYYQKSLNYYLKAFSIIEKLGYKHGIANYNKEVGTAYLKLGKLKDAQTYLLNGATGFDEIGYKEGAKESYKLLSETCSKDQDYKKAFEYYKNFIRLKDSLMNEETAKQLTETEIKYETEKKDNEILLLSKDKQIEEGKIKQQSKNILLIAAVAILLITSILIYIKFQQNKTALHLKDLEQKALRAQLNPHFIFNAMQSIQRSYAINTQRGEELLVNFSMLIREVLDKSISSVGTLGEEIELIKKYLTVESQTGASFYKLIINTDNAIDASLVAFPSLALQPIIENAVKYGATNSNIDLNIKRSGKLLIVVIENDLPGDNPAGINKRDIPYSGVGLRLTKERINLFNKKHRVNGGVETVKNSIKFITTISLAYALTDNQS